MPCGALVSIMSHLYIDKDVDKQNKLKVLSYQLIRYKLFTDVLFLLKLAVMQQGKSEESKHNREFSCSKALHYPGVSVSLEQLKTCQFSCQI